MPTKNYANARDEDDPGVVVQGGDVKWNKVSGRQSKPRDSRWTVSTAERLDGARTNIDGTFEVVFACV